MDKATKFVLLLTIVLYLGIAYGTLAVLANWAPWVSLVGLFLGVMVALGGIIIGQRSENG